jgi:trehalose 6-phosphate phosphatase
MFRPDTYKTGVPIMSKPFFDDIHEVEGRILPAPHILLCVDYDGTLTHFTATPIGAHLSPQMDRVVLSLIEHPDVHMAVFSGRDRADLQSRVGIPGLIYAGNHGLEISGPGFVFVEPTAAEQSNVLQEFASKLTDDLQAIKGVLVEFKGLTLSVHYRLVPQEQWDEVRRLVHAALAGATHPFVLTTGEKVFEIRPRVYWNKGNAVGWIKEQLKLAGVLCIYIGSDTTDEDAFAAMPDAITIRLGQAQITSARYSLESTTEVRKFLEWLEELLRNRAIKHEHVVSERAAQEAVLN